MYYSTTIFTKIMYYNTQFLYKHLKNAFMDLMEIKEIIEDQKKI